MKKLFIAALATLSINLCNAQDTQMKGVLSLEFGMTKEKVKDVILSKQPESKVYSSTPVSMTFQDVKWGAYKTFLMICQFSDDDRLHTVMFFLKPDHCSNIFTLYDEVTGIMTNKYNAPSTNLEHYRYPYEKKDKYRYTETMVKNGKVIMTSLWKFDIYNTPENENDNNFIKIAVVDDCMVQVMYQDGILIDQAVEKKKAKESNDY